MNATQRNPMIGESTSDTIGRCAEALRFLMSADRCIDDGHAGTAAESWDKLSAGHFWLSKCCLDALDLALEEMSAKAHTAQKGAEA